MMMGEKVEGETWKSCEVVEVRDGRGGGTNWRKYGTRSGSE